MTRPLLAYFNHAGLWLYQLESAQPKLLSQAPMDDQGQAILDSLSTHLQASTPCQLLLDLAEMDFRCEPLPRLRTADRKALIHRRLAQAYPETQYRYSAFLKAKVADNQAGHVLFAALHAPDWLSSLCAWASSGRFVLTGMTCLPLLQQALIKALNLPNSNCMLITPQAEKALRISVFRAGQLIFSRLAQLPLTADNALEELKRTHQYLLATRLCAAEEDFTPRYLLPETQYSAWLKAAIIPPEQLLPPVVVARACGLRLAETNHLSALHAALLLKGGFPNHFAPPEQRLAFRRQRAEHRISGITAGLLLAALCAALPLMYSQAKTETLVQQQVEALAQLNDRLSTMAVQPEPLSAEQLLAPWHAIQPDARQLLLDISRGFDAVPEAELASLHWFLSEQPLATTHVWQDMNGSDSTAPLPEQQTLQVLISGEIIGIDDPLSANQKVEQIRDAIASPGRLTVVVTRYPLLLASAARLHETLDSRSEHLPFSLHMRWKK